MIRFGIDLGGTKIEIVALSSDGRELLRRRIATPHEDYRGIMDTTEVSRITCTALRTSKLVFECTDPRPHLRYRGR